MTALESWIERARGRGGDVVLERDPTVLPAHVGLWLDRCWHEPRATGEEAKPGRRALYRVAVEALRLGGADTPALATYRRVFARWRGLVSAREPGVLRHACVVEATSRVLLHPASGATVTEGSVLLHHTYGVPYLPGSALKGLARRLATARLGEDPALMTSLFGFEHDKDADSSREDEAGALSFWDALWVPDPPNKVHGASWSPLSLDLVNPHLPDYYTKNERGDRFPDEREDPVPTQLLSLAPGARFLVVMEIPEALPAGPRWLDWMLREVLLEGLREEGIGARTTSGYGRLAEVPSPAARPATESGAVMRARVTFDKGGGGVLTAALPGVKPAMARGKGARLLREGLREELRALLDKRNGVELEVEWKPEGNARRIVRLGP